MRQVSMREFRTRGTIALQSVPKGETVLLSGKDGPTFFLVPVIGDVAAEDRELRRAIAKSSIRNNWKLAQTLPPISDEEIDDEIRLVRKSRATQMKK